MPDQTIGEIALGESTKLIFSVSEWRGRQFAGVRKFVATQKYKGWTKAGLSLNKKMLRDLLAVLEQLEKTLPSQEEHEFNRIPKNDTEYIKITTLPSDEEKVLPSVDIREFVDSPAYQGPTKRGIRFRWNLLPDVLACFREQMMVIGESEKSEPSLFGIGTFAEPELQTEEQPGAGSAATITDILGETIKQFPGDFLDDAASLGTRIDLPNTPLCMEQDNTGAYHLKTDDTIFCSVRNPTEANFILYAQLRGHRQVSVPHQMILIFKTVKAYENYLRGLRSRLFAQILKKARQESVANYEVNKIFKQGGFPDMKD